MNKELSETLEENGYTDIHTVDEMADAMVEAYENGDYAKAFDLSSMGAFFCPNYSFIRYFSRCFYFGNGTEKSLDNADWALHKESLLEAYEGPEEGTLCMEDMVVFLMQESGAELCEAFYYMIAEELLLVQEGNSGFDCYEAELDPVRSHLLEAKGNFMRYMELETGLDRKIIEKLHDAAMQYYMITLGEPNPFDYDRDVQMMMN